MISLEFFVTQTIEAIYEGGVLRPVKPLSGVTEHTRVKITVETPPTSNPLGDLVGALSSSAAAEMHAMVDAEFEKVDPREWQ